MAELRFRNINITPDDPIETWGFEGYLAAIERGDAEHWFRMRAWAREHPWAHETDVMLHAAYLADDGGVGAGAFIRLGIDRARLRAAALRHEVAEH